MQKHNKHWRRTHEKLQTLTFELLKTTVPERITVKQLCVAAKINRSTFYAHYLDVFDLVTQTQAVKRREMMCGFCACTTRKT
ncbi:TetR/AcrR family transcriptional regulator [Loigolactobacillus coryniformis]|uniref:TetR/AcrR family transcriptional regulator n=1 Tax=Loigolactobacillus coryniformis TaxID=1610 RepID=A0A5B8TG54_9LACO|nr:TetR/AcrR family transcriptional regulator [Loigolactobacillus coryniformis]QEA52825.1 TetR/AcrR family transcriptional regulator [Loigolactobacillus coryniformis]RRG02586.1 MAG: TetR/AcrR family transcriptional regulator [Lactobacillus sp.]